MKGLVASRRNPRVMRARSVVGDAAARREEGLFAAEGVRLVEEALAAGLAARDVLVSPRLLRTERGRALRESLGRRGAPILEVTDDLLDSISGVEHAAGVLVLLETPAERPAPPPEAPRVLLAGVRDPGNLGAIARTAHAAGAGGLLLLPGSVDWTNPKAVRASMGSLFHLPVHTGSWEEHLRNSRREGRRIVAAAPRGGVTYDTFDWSAPLVLALGAEAEGLPALLLDGADATVHIPLAAGVESLNVAAAAAVLLFEAARRRR